MKPNWNLISCMTFLISMSFFTLSDQSEPEWSAGAVLETERNIPVAYDVDVLVVGGSSGGVAAAREAAESGADVLLVTRKPYLGSDMCSTYRLWLHEGEVPDSPLAKAVYRMPDSLRRQALDFSYSADRSSAARHPETDPPSRLRNGSYSIAAEHSVQYDGDVTIIADLGSKRTIHEVRLHAFQRPDDAIVDTIDVCTSLDGTQWSNVTQISNEVQSNTFLNRSLEFSTETDRVARYVRFDIRKADNADRMLLAEITILGEEEDVSGKYLVRPLQVKKVLEDALLEAGAEFLYSSYITDILVDGQGDPAGVVMANRSGRQVVRAKTMIDATERAFTARLAGAEFTEYPAGKQIFTRMTVGGVPLEGGGGTSARIVSSRSVPVVMPDANPVIRGLHRWSRYVGHADENTLVEYTLEIDMPDGSFDSFSRAEQKARDLTWHDRQLDASAELFQVPPDTLISRGGMDGAWPGADHVSIEPFLPKGIEYLFVLGGNAQVSRDAAEAMLRPIEYMKTGARIGRQAALAAGTRGDVRQVTVRNRVHAGPVASGEVREVLGGIRRIHIDTPYQTVPERTIPVLGRYDVVVIGGGTGGAPATIAAARQGARTLVVEYQNGLGGVGTVGLIGSYWFGYHGGFVTEVDRGVFDMGHDAKRLRTRGTSGQDPLMENPGDEHLPWDWHVPNKMEWLRREAVNAGADIWFGSLGCGALVEDGVVKGVVVATPHGRGVVLSETVIDSTGAADIAIAAGADYRFTDEHSANIQGTGISPREIGTAYHNQDFTHTDDTDLVDIRRNFVLAKRIFEGAYDVSPFINTRERRRIVGDYTLSPLDTYNQRIFPDTISLARTNFDKHGHTVHPLFLFKPQLIFSYDWVPLTHVPYRSLLPAGLEQILVTGVGISAHTDSIPLVRMQACVQNQGYAAGTAAAMAAAYRTTVRTVDLTKVQAHLIDIGNLPADILERVTGDSFSQQEVARAVSQLTNGFDGIGVVLSQPDDALPHLRSAYREARNQEQKLMYAQVMGVLGDDTGKETLMKSLTSLAWNRSSRRTVLALANAGQREAIPILIEKINTLNNDNHIYDFVVISTALTRMPDERAAPALANLLKRENLSGWWMRDFEDARTKYHYRPLKTWEDLGPIRGARNRAQRELLLAAALLQCGDHNGMAVNILKKYEQDLSGHRALFAQSVLNTQP